MKKICLPLLAAGALLGLSTAAQAAPHQPYHATTVRWVVNSRDNLSVDDRYVTLVGHVTRRIGDEEYWFTDGTGSVRLDSENFDLPVGARIVVGGRIDQAYLGFGHLEVDVRHWHYAPLRKHPAAKPAETAAASPAPAPAPTPAPAPAPAASSEPATPASAPASSSSSLTPPADTSASTNSAPTAETNAVPPTVPAQK